MLKRYRSVKTMTIKNENDLRSVLDRAISQVRIIDIHTHTYPVDFGKLLLWGIDELMTYHYLAAETLRWTDMPYSTYWAMTKREQADLIWQTLFIDNTPYSEACRGVLTVLEKLGLDTGRRDLEAYRRYFAAMKVEDYIDKVFETSGVEEIVMTNDPFDDLERPVWEQGGGKADPRFKAALRVDPLLNNWSEAGKHLREWGYEVGTAITGKTIEEVCRFLRNRIDLMGALYLAVSLPPAFRYPEDSERGKLIESCILPVCLEKDIPFALMIGVKKLINPGLKLAGDAVGRSDIDTVINLCSAYPQNKFMVTMLARENQHELCIAARKFRNLMIFGCWWYLNNPSLIEETTRMRLELLGSSFIPQHSDARVLDQLIYKWAHSRKIIGDVLFNKYSDLMATGWLPEASEIDRDVKKLFSGNFRTFLQRKLP